MADINSKPETLCDDRIGDVAADLAPEQKPELAIERTSEVAGGPALPAGDLVKYVELLFFAYRDFTGDADELLADLGYGRAHHRVIHFVGRHPGLRVADLLDILRITKQSLARVLKQLIDEGFVTQQSGKTDRRERHLHLTQSGQDFAEKLSKLQCARIGRALDKVGPEARRSVEAFLVAMIGDDDQTAVIALLEKAARNEHDAQR